MRWKVHKNSSESLGNQIKCSDFPPHFHHPFVVFLCCSQRLIKSHFTRKGRWGSHTLATVDHNMARFWLGGKKRNEKAFCGNMPGIQCWKMSFYCQCQVAGLQLFVGLFVVLSWLMFELLPRLSRAHQHARMSERESYILLLSGKRETRRSNFTLGVKTENMFASSPPLPPSQPVGFGNPAFTRILVVEPPDFSMIFSRDAFWIVSRKPTPVRKMWASPGFSAFTTFIPSSCRMPTLRDFPTWIRLALQTFQRLMMTQLVAGAKWK